MKTVSLQEFQASVEMCLRAVHDGDTIIVMDGDTELARLSPPPIRQSAPGVKKHSEMTYEEKVAFYSRPRPRLLKDGDETVAEMLDWVRADKT